MPGPEGRHFKCSVYIAHPLPPPLLLLGCQPAGVKGAMHYGARPIPGPFGVSRSRFFSGLILHARLLSLGRRRRYSSLFLHISAK